MKTYERADSFQHEAHHHAVARELGYDAEHLNFTHASGGHMAYKRFFAHTPDGNVFFVKGQDGTLFTDAEREDHALQYLKKEHMFFNYLVDQGYKHAPNTAKLVDESYLMIDAFPTEHGWFWRAPRDNPSYFHLYLQDTLNSFDALQSLPIPSEDHFFPKRIMQVFMEEGWDHLENNQLGLVFKAASSLRPHLHESTEAVFEEALYQLADIAPYGRALYDTAQPMYLSHHDARQANIAWHPEFGAKNIDLSWADVGWRNADATMLLIDLVKAGHDVGLYMAHYFNPDHALLLMGHWFGRCAQPTRDGNPVVRLHQLASALTAFKMLKQIDYLPN